MQASASEAAAALRGHLLPAAASHPPCYNYAQALSNTKTHLKTNKIMERLFSQIASLGLGSKPGQYTTNLKKSHHAKLCQTQGFKIIELLSFFSARTSCYFSFFR